MFLATIRAALLPVVTALTLVAAELPYGHADFVPTRERPVGWRGGTGCGWYPGARNVATAWDDGSGKNIVWRSPLPFHSSASPIVVGGRVFTTAAPDALICLDAETGKELWRRSNNPILEKLPERERRQMLETHDTFLRLSRTWWYEGNRCEADFAWYDPKKGQPAAATEWLKSHHALLAELDLTDVDLAQLAKDFYGTRGDESKRHGLLKPDGWKLWFTSGMSTPVSDGRHVYAEFPSGALACYDLEGKRRWMTDRGLHREHSCVSSLALADGVLMTHTDKTRLVAYDADNGRELWEAAAEMGAWDAASPTVATVGGERVVLTGGGDVIRVRDGERLHRRKWNSFTGSSPIVYDNVVYSCSMSHGTEGAPGAVRLAATDNEGIEATTVWWWTRWWRGNKGYSSDEGLALDEYMIGAGRGSPAYADGYLYFVGGTEALELTVVDAASGKPVTQHGKRKNIVFSMKRKDGESLGILRGHETCPSATVADGHLFIGYSAVPRSLFVVFRILPGGHLREVARNTVEGMSIATPFFQGDRMYLRTFDYLYCIGK